MRPLQIAATALVALVSAAPQLNHVADSTDLVKADGLSKHNLFRRSDDTAKDFYLRIMPFGASITYGQESPDGNGYRKVLREALRYLGWNVNMVGNVASGNMNDNDVEGYPGYRVDQIHDKATDAMSQWQPNVVLVNCGTNDAVHNYDVSETGSRMEDLLEYIWSIVPDTVIVLSTILTQEPNPGASESINAQYRSLVNSLGKKGKKIVLAEMDDGWIGLGDLVDGIHPNEVGYQRMASRFYQAINIANDIDWITAPVQTGYDDATSIKDTTCYKTPASAVSDPRSPMQVLYARSHMIVDDGSYIHSSQSYGSLLTGTLAKNQKFWMAQLVNYGGGERKGAADDLVYSNAGKFYLRVNEGFGKFGDAVQLTTNVDCDADGTRFGDVNNDGLDDYLCLSAKGKLTAALNRGGNPPTFENVGVIRGEFSGDYTRPNVRLADIDGDGRIDYCLMKDQKMYCQRNGGNGETPAFWQDLAGIPTFTDYNNRDLTGVLLGDLNGDFKADFMYMADDGMIYTMINQRGDGDRLKPFWWDHGMTHGGMGVDGARAWVKLGRIYGSGRLDYVYFKCTKTDNDGTCHYEMHVWENKGSGATEQKGDGVFWCDMDGNGNDDYVFMNMHGDVTVFRNPNTPPATASAAWDEHPGVLKTGVDRVNLQLGDWDGDGKCDVIATDWDAGATYVWFTTYNSDTNKFYFSDKTHVASTGTGGGPSCYTGRGVGDYDLGVRYADLDGDGRVDYLCMELNGRTTGWLNKDGSTESLGQVKMSEGYDRANHRFADVNGDGRADFLWVDKFTGDATVWYNLGHNPDGGSNWGWYSQGKAYIGNSRGVNMHWPNLGGLGRADMVNVQPKTGYGWANFNTCGSSTGGTGNGDDGDLADPGLPAPPDNGDTDAKFRGRGGDDDENDDGDDGDIDTEKTQIPPGCTRKSTLPDPADWRFNDNDVSCTSDSVTDATCTNGGCETQGDRWNGLHTDDLLEWAVDEYLGIGGQKCVTSFPQWFTDKFHAAEGYNCGFVLSDDCKTGTQCDDVQYAPGAYFVLNSLATMQSVYRQAWTEVNLLQTRVVGNLSGTTDFMSTFCPKKKDLGLEVVKSILDAVLFVATAASAITWNKIIMPNAARGFTGDDRGAMKDSYNGAVALAFNLAKDNLKASASSTEKAEEINTVTNIWFDNMRQGLEDGLSSIMNVTEDTKEALPKALSNGKFMPNMNLNLDTGVFQSSAAGLLYALLIPAAWRLADGNYYPFVLETDDECSDDSSVKVSKQTKTMMSEKTAKTSFHCIDGAAYYLVSAQPPDPDCGDKDDDWVCDRDELATTLPGGNRDTIDTDNWGDLTFNAMIESVWKSWNANGAANNWAILADNDNVAKDPLAHLGVGPDAPFMYNIPFCEKAAFKKCLYNIVLQESADDRWDSWPAPRSSADN